MLTTPSSTVISIKCRLLRHSDFWVPVWDKDLNEKAAGIRFVSEENVTVSDKAAAASSKAGAALTFKGCPNLQHSRTKHISFWLLSVFLIKIVRRWEMVLLLSNMKMPWYDPSFQHPALGCSSVFWLRSICWVWAYSTFGFLPARGVPVDSTAYCSHWARCKELNSFRVFCTVLVLCKGQSWQVDMLCSCVIGHSGKRMFPFSVVAIFPIPIGIFPSPGLSPVLSTVSSQLLISSFLAMQVFFLNVVHKKEAPFSKQNFCEQ